MAGLCGCNSEDYKFKKVDPFLSLYTAQNVQELERIDDKGSSRTFDFSASEMPLTQFIRWFSDKTGCGVVYGAGADNSTLTAEYKKASTDDVMNSISRRFGLELIKINNTYYLGQLKPEDRGYLVRRIKGYDSLEIKAAIDAFLSEFGKVNVQKDGLTVVSDRESILNSVIKVLDALEQGSGDTWILQFYLITIKKELAVSAGADVATSGQVAYQFAKASSNTPQEKVASDAANFAFATLSQTFNGVLTGSSSFMDTKATPMFLLRDGTAGEWQDGKSIPIPRKTTSQYGVVTTEGFDYIDTGLVLKAKLRESSRGAFLTVDFTDSSIKGYIEYQPILSKSFLKTELEILSGKIYLIGELNKRDDTVGVANILDFSKNDTYSNIQLFCRAYRVGVPLPYKIEIDKKTDENGNDPPPSAVENAKK